MSNRCVRPLSLDGFLQNKSVKYGKNAYSSTVPSEKGSKSVELLGNECIPGVFCTRKRFACVTVFVCHRLQPEDLINPGGMMDDDMM